MVVIKERPFEVVIHIFQLHHSVPDPPAEINHQPVISTHAEMHWLVMHPHLSMPFTYPLHSDATVKTRSYVVLYRSVVGTGQPCKNDPKLESNYLVPLTGLAFTILGRLILPTSSDTIGYTYILLEAISICDNPRTSTMMLTYCNPLTRLTLISAPSLLPGTNS